MNPLEAYEYAVIYGPSKETRKIACKDPWLVYMYAKIIDKKPRKDTRKAACKNPEIAYWYAEDVDECFHKDT